jgi:hypothetical protein
MRKAIIFLVLALSVMVSACSIINPQEASDNISVFNEISEEEFINNITYDNDIIRSKYIPVSNSSAKYFFEFAVFKDSERIAATTQGFEGVEKNNPLKITILNAELDSTYKFYARILDENNTEVYKSTTFFSLSDKGIECITSDDCSLDTEYAMRSICPFAPVCLNNKCEAGCPIIFDDPCLEDKHCNCNQYSADDKKSCSCIEGTCYAVVN